MSVASSSIKRDTDIGIGVGNKNGKKPYGLVGDGKVASHFAFYFKQLGLPYLQWSRKLHPHTPVEKYLDGCDVILLLVSDPAIDPLAQLFSHKILYHFSGAHISSLARGAHPLMSFGPELYPLEVYLKIPFVLEEMAQDAGAQTAFSQIFPALANPLYSIRTEEKVRYHALCSMAGSFTGFLWAKLFSELRERFEIPPQAAVPFLSQLTKNLAAHPDESQRFFTGPIARGDFRTIDNHLKALEADPYRAVYEAFIQANGKQMANKWKSPGNPRPLRKYDEHL
jgi:hypothetical protein